MGWNGGHWLGTMIIYGADLFFFNRDSVLQDRFVSLIEALPEAASTGQFFPSKCQPPACHEPNAMLVSCLYDIMAGVPGLTVNGPRLLWRRGANMDPLKSLQAPYSAAHSSLHIPKALHKAHAHTLHHQAPWINTGLCVHACVRGCGA